MVSLDNQARVLSDRIETIKNIRQHRFIYNKMIGIF